MMKNKKIAALLGVLLAGSMAFSLSACGSTNNASDNKSSGSSSQSSDKKGDSSSGAGFEEVPVGPSGTAEEQDKDDDSNFILTPVAEAFQRLTPGRQRSHALLVSSASVSK